MDKEEYMRITELLNENHVSWDEREEREYTNRELRGFPLLVLAAFGAGIDGGDPRRGTIYDLSEGCSECGTGSLQTSPLFAGESGLRKKKALCATYYGHLLVDLDLADAFGMGKVFGLELRQVRSYRNNPMPWWQIIAPYVMPRMNPKTRGIIVNEDNDVAGSDFEVRSMPPCWKCRRDGRYNPGREPVEVVYTRGEIDIESLPDFAQTWECFGRSIARDDTASGVFQRIAQPWFIVKQRVFDLFVKRGLRKHASFLPVLID